ncbi:MAB_1171c family putative transporter [Streptomyces sp. Li-HN-5-11]|uniref:MAB_1171c family putative transporter n=1 Tax=Streptomyces sp. Li-HN-5-11 TaxID=3075432 RepID=UPI0028A6A441|nr:MAB_1171c family putative transporter [Streptomyces sp. Li-HN-5-11]WNM33654.1 MAB_1171c family putative transporter [Streptomyces sp. Li-HN-5-11]
MIDTLPAVLLWLVTAWRTPAAWRDPGKRVLWIAFLALAVAITLRVPSIAAPMNAALGANNLSSLGKNLGCIVAAHAVLTFVHDMAQEKAAGLKSSRLHLVFPTAAAAIITVLFFATPQPREAVDLLTEYASDWRIAAYGRVWTAYLGAALFSASRLCWRWGRQPDAGLLGRGLRLAGMGTTIGIVYAAHRVAAVVLGFLGQSPIPASTSEEIGGLLLFSALLFIVTGSTLPAAGRLRRWIREYRDLLELYPLWLSLTEAVPSVRLDPPRRRTSEILHPRHLHDRLYHRTIEIRDAVLTLSDHAPSSLRDQARAHVAASGLIGAQADIAAEACWIIGAQQARRHNEPSSGDALPPASGGRDLPSEIHALKQLSRAYDSDLTRAFAAKLDHARTLETTH